MENESGALAVPEAKVIYEDEWLLAADKPAGILVHGDGTGVQTLTDLIRQHLCDAGEPQAAEQLQAVQRLDVDTTGIVLFSKDKAVQPKLDALVAAHCGPEGPGRGAVTGIQKRYLAVVRGSWPWERREIDAPIARDRHDARRMRQASAGKPAMTRVRKLAEAGGRANRMTLLLVELGTGRKHQIRVHLSSCGFPIVGDALYGIPKDRAPRGNGKLGVSGGGATVGGKPFGGGNTGAKGRPGLMLHAWEERFVHPVTGEPVALRSPYPERFEQMFPYESLPDAAL